MRKIQMVILLFIHQFCIDNHIQYSLAWGTMLGVFRHKGYIPWDDDIDFMMTCPEYDRFYKLFHDDHSIYKLYDVHKDKKWIYPFTKISNEHTIRVEKNALDEISCVASKGNTASCGFLATAVRAVVLKSEIFDKYAEYQFASHRFHSVENYDSY